MATSTMRHGLLLAQLPYLPWLRDHNGDLNAEAGRVWLALLSDPDDLEAWEDYLWLVGFQDPYLMVDIAKHILKSKPKRQDVWRALSVAASMIGDSRLAYLAAYRCSRSGGKASDWVRLGILACEQGHRKRVAQASKEALRMCQLQRLVPSELVDLGRLLQRQGNTAKASEFFSIAILSDGDIADAWNGLAEIKEAERRIACAEALRIQGCIIRQRAWEKSPLGALFCSEIV